MVLFHTLPAALCWKPAGSPEPSQLTPAEMLSLPLPLQTVPGISPSLGTSWRGDSECVELRFVTALL